MQTITFERRECSGEGEGDCLSMEGAQIEQLSESETHTCLRLAGQTTCVMNVGLENDKETGTIYSRFDSDWLQAIVSAGRLSDLSSGDFFSCGIRADDKRLLCWGSHTTCATGICSPPTTEGGFAHVSCGTYHACAITADESRVLCWGSSDDGEAQPPPGAFTSVSAGSRHSCGVRVDGQVLCWGSNEGVGEKEGDLTWQATPPPIRFQAVAAGEMHTCGIVARDEFAEHALQLPPPAAGKIVCWGDNSRLQASPPAIDAVAIFAGSLHSCAVAVLGGLLVCWGDKSISPRFSPGQRGAANPPEDLTICAKQLRHHHLVHVGFRAISESFLHNVVDGASLLILPSHVSPYSTPLLMLSPSYLRVDPPRPPSNGARTTQTATSHLEVTVYRATTLLRDMHHAQQREDARFDAAHSARELQVRVVCYYAYINGAVAGEAVLEEREGGVGVAVMDIVTQGLREGTHDLECVLVQDSEELGQGAKSIGDEGNSCQHVASIGGHGAVFVSHTGATLEIVRPVAGAEVLLAIPAVAHDADDAAWYADNLYIQPATQALEVSEETPRVVMVAVELELKAQCFEGWGASAAVHVWAGGERVSIIHGPGAGVGGTTPNHHTGVDADSMLHVLGLVKVRLDIPPLCVYVCICIHTYTLAHTYTNTHMYTCIRMHVTL